MLVAVLVALGLSLGVGFWLQRTRARAAAWLFLLVSIAAADRLLANEPAGFRMLALVAFGVYAMKALVGVEAHRAGAPPLPFARWLAFAALWLGMKPGEFARRGPARVAWRLIASSLTWIVAGSLTIAVAHELFERGGPGAPRLPGYAFIVGCSMVLHFGFIGLVAAALRALGFAVEPQFRAPWRSETLQEFWARRWNVGFSVMTAMTVYRPTVRSVGRPVALALGFVASGLLHELGCSLPVDAGYGLPSIYFALHALAVALEHALQRRGLRLRGWWARAWVFAWLLLPLPLLFHEPFLRGIVLPLL